MKKKKTPSKAALQRELAAARSEADRLAQEKNTKDTLLQMKEREIEKMITERARYSALVDRIIRIIQAAQPHSALLPESLRSREYFDSQWTRMTPPPKECSIAEYMEHDFKSFEPLSPIVLNDLTILLQHQPETYNRLVVIGLKLDRSQTLHRVALKFSDEMLSLYRGARELFLQDIGRDIAAKLHAELTTTCR